MQHEGKSKHLDNQAYAKKTNIYSNENMRTRDWQQSIFF